MMYTVLLEFYRNYLVDFLGGKCGKKLNKKLETDWIVTLVPVITVMIVGILIAFKPDAMANALWTARDFFVNDLGVIYMVAGIVMFIGSLVIAFSKYGRIRLGKLEKPKYSTFSWGAMIFTSTMAADVLYWSIIEWAYYLTADPLALGDKSLAMTNDIIPAYSLFHWGPMGWVFYVLPAAALAYMIFANNAKSETLSEACRPVFGNRVDGWTGKVIDIFCIAGLLAGCATIFSVATPMITSCIVGVTGMEESKWITIGVLVFTAGVFTTAVVVGMEAIEWVANKSVYLYILLGGVCLFFGPTRYIIETGMSSIGYMLTNFVSMATWMDPLRISGANGFGFPQDWTVFFYANWISWSVATPMFIAKISEGRSIKNMILGAYACGISATFLSFIIFGNFGFNLEMTGVLDVSGMLNDGATTAAIILEILKTMPFSKFIMVVVVITMIGLYASTFDATTLVLAGFSQKNRPEGVPPSKGIMILWSIILVMLPISMVFAESILTTMQTISIIAALPILIVELIILFGFIKELRTLGVSKPVPPLVAKNNELVFNELKYNEFKSKQEKMNA